MALNGICVAAQIRRIFHFSKFFVGGMNESSVQELTHVRTFNFARQQYFSTIKNPLNPRDIGKKVDPNAPRRQQPEKQKKNLTSPEITLLSPEDKLTKATLEQAEKLAKRRNLKLVKIVDFDTKTERAVYKLMTTSQFFEEEYKSKELQKQAKKSDCKEQKMFTISTKIDNHDLQIKIKQIFKTIQKRHEVCIYVTTDGNPPRVDEISAIIQEGVAEIASQHKVVKESHGNLRLKFYPKTVKEMEMDAQSKAENEKNNKSEDNKTNSSSKKSEKMKLDKEEIETSATQ